MSLLVLGTMAFDSIETPFGKAERILGGAATYICWAASHFYNDVKTVSIVGGDFPEDEMKILSDRGVNLDGVEVRNDEKSFYWSGKYHMDMNTRDTLVTELNVLETFEPKLPEAYQNVEYVMLGNFAPAVQLSLLDQLEYRPKLVIADTMNFWMDVALDELKQLIRKIDVLTINDEEARQLSGEHSLVKAAKVIQAMGPDYVIIKKGEHGALLFHNSEVFYAPALPLESVFDPTGAGDTFAGGFVGYLAETHDFSFEGMKRAVIYGSVMASFCVEQFGMERLRTLKKSEIHARTMEFIKLTRFEVEHV